MLVLGDFWVILWNKIFSHPSFLSCHLNCLKKHSGLIIGLLRFTFLLFHILSLLIFVYENVSKNSLTLSLPTARFVGGNTSYSLKSFKFNVVWCFFFIPNKIFNIWKTRVQKFSVWQVYPQHELSTNVCKILYCPDSASLNN